MSDLGAIGSAPASRLHVMSFNALFQTDSSSPGDPGHWEDRAPAIEAMLAADRPDLLGLQEMQSWTFGPIDRALGPTYRSIGMAESGGSDGLINPILYDTERLELLGWNQFWLSDRPREMGSATWGNARPRTAVRAHFRDRVSGLEFGHINTHLDHVITQAKTKGAQLISDHLEQFRLLRLPSITTGDFNSIARRSPAYTVLVEDYGLQDSWLAAEKQHSPGWGTFPFFDEVEESDVRIDWILLSQDVRVVAARIDDFRLDGVFPSDHLPVHAHLELTADQS